MSWSELQPFQHVPILIHDELHLMVSHVEGSHRAALDGAVDTRQGCMDPPLVAFAL